MGITIGQLSDSEFDKKYNSLKMPEDLGLIREKFMRNT